MLSEIKENVQGNNSDGKNTGTQINNLDQKEEINIQLEQKENSKLKTMRRGLRTSGTTLNVPHPNHRGSRRRRGKARI